MKDKALLKVVKNASAGNQKAFVELCNLKAREIIYLCVIEMRDQNDGEDAAQEVFIRMQKSITSLMAPEAFNVWLNRLVHNTCYNMKRDNMKHKDSIEASVDMLNDSLVEDDEFLLPQDYAEDAEMRERVAEVVRYLPDKYREPLVLHYYQSLSYKQISDVLRVSVNTVNNNIRMARKHLKEALEERAGQVGRRLSLIPLLAAGPILAVSLQESSAAVATPAVISTCLAKTNPMLFARPRMARAKAASGGKTAKAVAASVAIVAAVAVLPIARAILFPPAAEPSSSVAALPVAAEVSGTIWVKDGKGEQAPLVGVALHLEGEGGAEKAPEQTGASGAFSFGEVLPGEYALRLTLPHTTQAVPVLLGGEERFVLTEQNSSVYTGMNIVLDLSASVSGHIDLRLDNESLQYEERYLPGVAMQLIDPLGKLVAEAGVKGDGTYHFDNPLITRKGTYVLRVAVNQSLLGENIQINDTEIELYPGFRN